MPKTLTITNPKRSSRNLAGRDVWFPYYAGFSRTFATSLIRSAEIREGGWVLDPWNGSGTTTSSAFSLACPSIGIDLNPVMAIAAKARILCRREKGSLMPLLVDILRKAGSKDNEELSEDDALLTWFAPTAAGVLRNIEHAIQRLLLQSNRYSPVCEQGDLREMSDICAFFYAVLFRTARELTARRSSSNPTWTRRPRSKQQRLRPIQATVFQAFKAFAQEMIDSIEDDEPKSNATKHDCHISVGDSQCIPNENESIDLVLGSPPYCTRLDYAVATAIELAVIGSKQGDNFAKLRQRLLGTTTVPVEPPNQCFGWGSTCAEFLDRLFKHSSKASATYYFKNHVQYFHGLQLSIREIARVLRRQGRCVLVLQDSYYKDVHNDLPSIAVEMAEANGMRCVQEKRFPVRVTMAGVNPKVRPYRTTCEAVESVVVLQKDTL